MKTFKEYLIEGGTHVMSNTYSGVHGKVPSGEGRWTFSKSKRIDPDKHKENEDYFTHRGSYSDAKVAASKWAKSKGHSFIHVIP